MLLFQKKYVAEILEGVGMRCFHSCRTPMDTNAKIRDDGSPWVCLYMMILGPHLTAHKRILPYVSGTLDYGLQLYASSTSSLVAYSDVDWVGCPTTRRSTFGSSAEAKYRGVANVMAETSWLRNLLSQVRVLHVSSRYQYADIFTKSLPFALFDDFCTGLSVRHPLAPTAGGC
ncbi:ribonuclease H-like domain-containing protein [Tanacetum coccineum]|uniref:Ribonuclease H-like domain-containing protein n=1 Tax=Tanacetum coccineum TaxID=301880 RepID=A0ABQ5I753_9ASTR